MGAAVATAVGALMLRDPHRLGSWGRCPFALVTGYPCPLCGGLRAVHDLARGDVLAALASNAAVVVALPVLLTLYGVWVRARWSGRPSRTLLRVPAAAAAWVVGLVCAFGVVRAVALGSPPG